MRFARRTDTGGVAAAAERPRILPAPKIFMIRRVAIGTALAEDRQTAGLGHDLRQEVRCAQLVVNFALTVTAGQPFTIAITKSARAPAPAMLRTWAAVMDWAIGSHARKRALCVVRNAETERTSGRIRGKVVDTRTVPLWNCSPCGCDARKRK